MSSNDSGPEEKGEKEGVRCEMNQVETRFVSRVFKMA